MCIRDRTNVVRHSFDTQNFSFILKGSGYYSYRQTTYQVQAPCVITQAPDEPMDYGPHEWWSELYLIYHRSLAAEFKRRRFLFKNRPLWPVPRPTVLHYYIEMLMRLFDSAAEPYVADKIDRLCEMLILESISRSPSVKPSREELIVRDLEARLRKDFSSAVDINGAARAAGLHPATLRRHWAQLFTLPPARHRMRLRMNEACRMLVETRRTVREIAFAVGFDAPLYFSRKFRQMFGCTAGEYRRRHRSSIQVAG